MIEDVLNKVMMIKAEIKKFNTAKLEGICTTISYIDTFFICTIKIIVRF